MSSVVIVGASMKEGATVTTHDNAKGLVRAFDVKTGDVIEADPGDVVHRALQVPALLAIELGQRADHLDRERRRLPPLSHDPDGPHPDLGRDELPDDSVSRQASDPEILRTASRTPVSKSIKVPTTSNVRTLKLLNDMGASSLQLGLRW